MSQMKEGSTSKARAASLAFGATMAGVLPGATLAGQLADQASPSAKAAELPEARPDLHARVEAAAKRLRSERPAAMPGRAPLVRQVQWRNG